MSVAEAKGRLSELVRDAHLGKVAIIMKRQKPIVQLIPIKDGEVWIRREERDSLSISRVAQIAIELGQYDLAKQILQLQGV